MYFHTVGFQWLDEAEMVASRRLTVPSLKALGSRQVLPACSWVKAVLWTLAFSHYCYPLLVQGSTKDGCRIDICQQIMGKAER